MITALLSLGLWVQDAAPNELIAANFFSHLCGPCLVLDIRLEPVIDDYADAPIRFVRLDQTFGRNRARRAATEFGISDIYEGAAGASGFVLLINPATGEVVDTITIAHDETEIRQRLDRAIHFASQ